MTSPPAAAATINAPPVRMNIRPSGPASPPAPVSAPALGVLDLFDGVTVTVAVLVLVGLGLVVVGVGLGVELLLGVVPAATVNVYVFRPDVGARHLIAAPVVCVADVPK
ncbi:MAG: hypothetical protein HOY71_27200, partial [Nonomuraea sp.]|nr:hypothetical protein [Nonomuraea sp.]